MLVERDASILSYLAPDLAREGFAVDMVDDGHAAYEAVATGRPAAVVVGRMSSSLGRLDFCRALRMLVPGPEMAIIVVLARELELLRIACIEEGADDCIVEPFTAHALALRIRTLLRRYHMPKEDARLRYAGLEMDVDQIKLFHQGRMVPLRPMVFQLLRVFLERPETILSRADIRAHAGWPAGEGSDRSIDSHVRTLRAALAAAGARDLIRTVRSWGYALSVEEIAPPAAAVDG
ncbi:response regulator transcription factor [Sphingomonas oleivorans]|uniref:response regulator transcription factor n=1 Tax=Sphingomonas oleivorans TaxID=1735121 RepID=UPI0013FD1CAC|nr:response regulator transcription factor [Sphingomonas oleivorans]